MPLHPPRLTVDGLDVARFNLAAGLVRLEVDAGRVDSVAVDALLSICERILRDHGLYDARGVLP